MENLIFCSVFRRSRRVFKTLPKCIIELSSQEKFITDTYNGIKYFPEVCDGHHKIFILTRRSLVNNFIGLKNSVP